MWTIILVTKIQLWIKRSKCIKKYIYYVIENCNANIKYTNNKSTNNK